MNVLCLVPHGDDEILLAGGSLAKHKRKNDRVTVCILKGDNDDRNSQQLLDSIKVAEQLNFDGIYHLNLSEHTISTDVKRVSYKIEEFLATQQPFDLLYTISPDDNHQDHQGTYRAINVAARATGPYAIPTILCGEVVSSTDQTFGITRNFQPTLYNILNEDDIKSKIDALSLYSSEMRQPPHPRSLSNIKTLASLRGAECNQKYAEAFMIARQYISE